MALLQAKQFAASEAIEGAGGVGASAAGRFNLAAAAAGFRFLGSAGGDSVTGRNGADDITAGAGADRIEAGGGADVIRVGRFDVGPGETISGGAGSDTILPDHLADFAPAACFEGIAVLQTGGRVFRTAAQLASLQRVENIGVGFVEVTAAAAGTFSLSKVLLGSDVRLVGSAGADISAAAITGFERLLTNQSTAVTPTAAQLAGFAEVDGTTTLVRLVAASAGTYDPTGKVAAEEVGLTGSARGADSLTDGAGDHVFA